MKMHRYIFMELFKSFVIGCAISVVVLLGLQFLRLSELIVRYDVDRLSILKMVFGLGTSFLPLITPIAFLFACLSVFGRFALDREFVALMSLGISPKNALKPAYILAACVSIFTLWTSFTVGPRGNRMFEVFVDEAFRRKVASSLRSGTFSEGFLGLVIFVDKVDQTMTRLERVFIHDESSFKNSVSISAKTGSWSQSDDDRMGVLKLQNGVLVSQIPEREVVRRIEFDEYKIFADFARQTGNARESPPSLDVKMLLKYRNSAVGHPELDARPVWTELGKRIALSFVALLFAPLAFYLSFDTGRTAKSRAVFTGLVVILVYWTTYFALVTYALKNSNLLLYRSELACYFLVWVPNFVLVLINWMLSRSRNGKPNRFLVRLGF